MSEMLDNVLAKNLLNLALDQPLMPELAAPGHGRLNRSASFFSPPSSSDSSDSCSNVSSEHINYNDVGGPLWSSNIWSLGSVPEPRAAPFRADRSMSLTESTSSLLSTFRQLKNLEAFPSATTAASVPPPPGFPPSSNLPPQMQPMASPNRYKTELCRGFQETGSCKYGSKCQFAHGEAELRGLYRHPKYKTEPCRTFYNFGYCPYGSRCHFIHEDKLSGGPLSSSAKFPGHQQQQQVAGPPTLRHQLRQSVSFAGFLGSSRGSPPPPSSFDLNLGFSRAPSVSPPPADLLSPVFSEALQREAAAFQFGGQQSRASAGDIHSIPLILEPKSSSPSSSSRCVCGHGNNFNGNNIQAFGKDEDPKMDSKLFTGPGGHPRFTRPAGLQRSSSEDSLEDSYSSSGGSSGSESPTFDASSGKRLIVFERLSLSD
ncbi:uncharacterized protein LOC142903818 [Nelusetta ayraudi]|uniref:uncharacterized protein LOC142903818 n=1 Tax=Nelusetta ayraudi TaxID=303726 RepID=UPI003F70ECF0